jgi:hypothetical protein
MWGPFALYWIIFIPASLGQYYLTLRYKNITCYDIVKNQTVDNETADFNITNISEILNEDHFIADYVSLSINMWILCMAIVCVVPTMLMFYIFAMKNKGTHEDNIMYTISKWTIILCVLGVFALVAYGFIIYYTKECYSDEISRTVFVYIYWGIIGGGILKVIFEFSLISVEGKKKPKEDENEIPLLTTDALYNNK